MNSENEIFSKNDPVQIAGWGIAGATLAWNFYFRNQSFSVSDPFGSNATRVAAGIVNPIVFKRLTKGWNVDVLMPYAETFYERIETLLDQKILHRKKILYPFSTREDENNWSVKMGDDRFKNYLFHTKKSLGENVQHPFGLGEVNTLGYLDTVTFLNASRSFFESKGISFSSEKILSNHVRTNRHTSYFFCEGVGITQNDLFNYLPLKIAHGEVLVLESDEVEFSDVVSKNLYILPLANHRFKIGSTYNWELTEAITTELGKSDLLERFENLVDCRYTIAAHEAGLRPTVPDRRPLIGSHPVYSNAFVFNGLGTKGVLLAPFYANHLVEHFLDNLPLAAEVDTTRFKKRFKASGQGI